MNIDEENDLTRFVLSCEVINGDVLRLNKANAQIIVGESTGLRIPASAVHYLKDDGSEAEGQGENYIPGVYVKYGNLARFCKIDPVDADHPQVQDGDHLIDFCPVERPVRSVRFALYDEIIVSGQKFIRWKTFVVIDICGEKNPIIVEAICISFAKISRGSASRPNERSSFYVFCG